MEFYDYSFKLHKIGSHIVSYQPARLTSTGAILYNGFIAEDGSWVIMERHIANGTIKYVRGASGFAAAWTARTTQTYVEFNELFE